MPKLKDKPFVIPKPLVWEAYRRVRANKGAPGVDGQDLDEFEADLQGNLYRIWNRMSSGSYFPPAVRAVQIPKPHGGGVRMLGVPTIADRVAQTVVAMHLEPLVEPKFHPDSYGYRPGKAAHHAIGACRARCWKYDWVIDLDVRKFFDTVPWDLVVKAVTAVCTDRWVLLYVKRWLVSRLVDSLAVAGDRFEDLLGGFGPDVGAWVLVPVLDPGADVGVEGADAGVRAAAQQLGGQLPEPALDEVDPAAGGRGEVQDEPRVLSEPSFDLRGLVGGT